MYYKILLYQIKNKEYLNLNYKKYMYIVEIYILS